jgi:hypothetical protein
MCCEWWDDVLFWSTPSATMKRSRRNKKHAYVQLDDCAWRLGYVVGSSPSCDSLEPLLGRVLRH